MKSLTDLCFHQIQVNWFKVIDLRDKTGFKICTSITHKPHKLHLPAPDREAGKAAN